MHSTWKDGPPERNPSPEISAGQSISAMANDCKSILDHLHQEVATGGTLLDDIDDHRARFRIWASNIGALQRQKSRKSLDFRLREATLMRQSATSMLENLRSCLTRVNAILSTEVETVEPVNKALAKEERDDLGLATDLMELLSATRTSIDQLFRLSMLIRRQRPRGRLHGLSALGTSSTAPDITYVCDKYPKIRDTPWLAERLGSAITRRRDYILYRQLHRSKLARREDETDEDDASDTIATTYREDNENLDASPLEFKKRRGSAVSVATSLFTAFGDVSSRSIPDLADMTLDGIRLQYGEEFECPFCRTIQLVSNRLDWKKHVFADLEPYICTFKDCEATLFATRGEWFRHETSCHRRRWRCVWCRDELFTSDIALRDHLGSVHIGVLNPNQVPLILESAEDDIRYFEESTCPLCEDWAPGPRINGSENWREFRRHLGRHMQQLSLEGLPLSIEGLEVNPADGTDSHLDAFSGRDVVYCHSCSSEWYRDKDGLTCPDCGSDVTEIVAADSDPRDYHAGIEVEDDSASGDESEGS